ncbi:MAG: outer membrane protein assembly factor BamD [Gammaproteobacteria bacterium]|nr:outer membrane protein assembly factor BamD [Gammaproteobacteria bacterium]
MLRTLLNISLRLPLLITLLLGGCATTLEDETADWTAQRFYDEARDALNNESYSEAIKYYTRLEARYPYGRYAQQAQLEVAYAHYKADESAATIAAADRFIQLNPRHANVDYAYYLKGLAAYDIEPGTLDRLGNQDRSERDPKRARESFNFFKELITRFPQSQYREDSIDRMGKLRNSLARYEIHVADYYMRRGAYLAAVNRAKYVVEHYPQTPAVIDAMKLMVNGYRQLKMDDLAADAERVLHHNYPEIILSPTALKPAPTASALPQSPPDNSAKLPQPPSLPSGF